MVSSDSSTAYSTTKWLAVVGIGEDGIAGLGERAKGLIAQAQFVFGGKRHLQLVEKIIEGEAHSWAVPFDSEMKAVLSARGQKVCVLASGDPLHFGVGATLARHIDPAEIIVVPAPSAFSLAAARLGWALQDLEMVSLHGRSIDLIRPVLHAGRRALALASDGAAAAAIARLLTREGFGASGFTVLESLGGNNERVSTHVASELGDRRFADLNIVALEIQAAPGARILPLGFGLADELFAHDGQITKREVRATTLSALAPQRGELLWDVGAGSGSVGIEWMLAHRSMQAIAIEKDEGRAARIGENAVRFGVPGLTVVHAGAPDAFDGLESPDAIFIGGGGSRDGVADSAIEALRPGGRIVANAVTLDMEAVLLALHAKLGGNLTRISVSRAEPVGTMSGWRPAMPVTQWSWVKP